MANPLVTIVITAYNYGSLLPTAIESALGQDYEALEVLVLDNASTDDTPEVLARYAADPRFRAIRNETNIGLTPNHNKGLREARGDFIGFLSADDALTPGCVTRAMRYYDEHPEVDVLFGSAYFMDPTGSVYAIRQMMGQPHCAYAGGRNELAALLSEGCYMCTPTMLVRRTIWERYGGFDETKHAADWELSARWAKHGLRFAYLPEALAVVRIHPEQHSGTKQYVTSGRDMREYLSIVDQYLDATTPERYAGYEKAIGRLLDGRAGWLRHSMPDLAAEFEPVVEGLRERLTAIEAINTGRRRTRLRYVVIVESWIQPLEMTLRTLLAQTDPSWRAVVVQLPGVSYGPLCRMIDPERIRHVQTDSTVTLGQMVNTALRVEDGDIFTVLRAGARVGPDHAATLKHVFTDPAARIAINWPRFYVDPEPGGAGESILIEELSRPPVGAFDVMVGPEVEVEAMAFARELYDAMSGFNPTLPALVNWEFLIRATLHAGGGFRGYASPLEVHVAPGARHFAPTHPNVHSWVERMHLDYPVNDPQRQSGRSAYLARLAAALKIAQGDQMGLVDFYRMLSRSEVPA